MTSKMKDKDLARMFENCYPNTLDTTAVWVSTEDARRPQAHINAGDMNAAWLRDNLWQIQPYAQLLPRSPSIRALWLGIINTQGSNIRKAPYSNSFQPPPESGLAPVREHLVDMSRDLVYPPFDPNVTFEAKYAIDSLASFLRLCRVYHQHTSDGSFMTDEFVSTISTILQVVQEQSEPTFAEDGRLRPARYSFMRPAAASAESPYNGPETVANSGAGNPANSGTGLVRSAFRASDDACILPFWIPGNAFLAAELEGAEAYLSQRDDELARTAKTMGSQIRAAVYGHAVFPHPVFGEVFAYEIDGYGSRVFMDDASPPSLLALPYLGFCRRDDRVYQNTRRMVLSREGNPYFVVGKELCGQGSPHIDLKTMWPVGTVVQILTSDDDGEIVAELETLKKASGGLGLMHEGVDVNDPERFLRTWYAWGNSAFGEMILDISERKPWLIF
ncbi:hypothetical protein CONLIGDRAFT_62238 [Coniochaeta ligniaria NRRL 30616]|uniref:Glycoside hydrolase family 125 protein n=1 Tax=Coniochaeta ligniaria NRRL 30616 TaxID=1408157 RepID=A0A1J7J5V9_9PEZI|nr:hypothetical protein CONLIGDRAFT_62238 [Coniochaeta ligniaria NRRL 30616]